MIAWALLLLSALSSSAKPIYEDHNLRPFQAQKLGINDQTEGNHLTTDSQLCQQDCNFLIDSADSAGRAQASTLAEALVVTLGVSSRQTGLATRSDASGRGNVQGTEVLTAVPKIALVKRNQIKLVSFKPYSYLFPASIAAAQMRDFFDAVWLESTYRWPNERPPSDFFSISLGSFQLTISCLGATVPWTVIASAARRYSLFCHQGLPATFDAFYLVTGNSIPLWISFRIMDEVVHRPTKRSKPLPRLSHGQEAASPAGSSLSRRTLIPSSGLTLKMTNFRSFFALVPTVLAAARLEEFYDVIALKIETGQFSNWQPSRYIILSMWNFEFSVSCDKCFVPWSLVQDWVIDMAALSSQQFTGLYEATVRGEGPFSGFVFLIHMRLKDPR